MTEESPDAPDDSLVTVEAMIDNSSWVGDSRDRNAGWCTSENRGAVEATGCQAQVSRLGWERRGMIARSQSSSSVSSRNRSIKSENARTFRSAENGGTGGTGSGT